MMASMSEARPASAARESRIDGLCREHLPRAVAFACLLSGSRQQADDLAQEALVRLIGRLGHLRSEAAIGAYVRRTIVNLHLDGIRRSATARRTRPDPPPAVALPDVEERHHVRSLMAELPARQRAAVVLRYYEDLSEKEAARILRCSVPALRALTGRGLDALRTRMEAEGP
jgi:RNA polymerase sigma factor (sigma-70 family)